MALKEQTLFEHIDKVDIAIKRLQTFEPKKEGYYLAFSGGKDSVVIKELANMAGVKYDAHYNFTTIDPPELVKFIKAEYPDVIFNRPKESFFKLVAKKGFPQRQRRWCCELLKEGGGVGRRVVTGVRWAESFKRSKRKLVEQCYKNRSKKYLNVIIDWLDSDVWEYIKKYNIKYCSLYDEGWKRLGCLFCPASSRRKIEVERYPKFKKAFIRAFNNLYENKKDKWENMASRWESGEAMFDWWINESSTKEMPDQMVMFE
jgi:phosphoadenosine phosphosulfate reductase